MGSPKGEGLGRMKGKDTGWVPGSGQLYSEEGEMALRDRDEGPLTHGRLGEVVAPTVHGGEDVIPVGVDVEVAITIGHEDGESQVLYGRVGPWFENIRKRSHNGVVNGTDGLVKVTCATDRRCPEVRGHFHVHLFPLAGGIVMMMMMMMYVFGKLVWSR